jgi:spoIIIJ-associated protein
LHFEDLKAVVQMLRPYLNSGGNMDKKEVGGRTVEEAVQIAARELGIGTDAVEYEIVEEGAKGFLGLGQSPTLIKAWVREGYTAMVSPSPASTVQPASDQGDAEPEPEEAVELGGESDQFQANLLKILEDILGAMDLAAKPVVKSVEDDEITVDIQGGDVAILIGRQGQTLDALQYLLSIAANRDCGTRWRVNLDAGGFRDHHREVLENKAREYAAAVKSENQEAELEPQSARDRRIVHMALADDPEVYTYSEGEGDNRHVVISPKK